MFFAFRRFGAQSVVALAAAMIATLGLAALTYWVMERRAQRVSMSANRTLLAFIAAPLLAAGIVAGIGKLTDGFLFAYPARIQADVHWSGTALFDMPRAKDCWSKVEVTAATVCKLGDPEATDSAILWGDSHAYHLI